jgi:hypothetical protein
MGGIKNVGLSFSLSALLAFPALAVTTVDVYQNMEYGTSGEILTNQPQTSNHGNGGTWVVVGDTMTVSTNHTSPLSGAVAVNGVLFSGAGDTRSWMTDDATMRQYVVFRADTPHEAGTMGLFLSVGENAGNPTGSNKPKQTVVNPGTGNIYDAVIMGFGPETNVTRYAVCQIWDAAGGPYLEIESNPNNVTTHSFPIQIQANTTYWVTLKYNGASGVASLAIYNPTNWSLVGSTTSPQLTNTFQWISFGREDHHYNGPSTHSYFDNILIDYSGAIFPLLPGTNAPAPLTIAHPTNSHPQITLTSIIGRIYTIEASTNFTSWTSVFSGMATSNSVHFTDTNSTLKTRFYRAFAQ